MAANRIFRSAVLSLLKAPFFALYGVYALTVGYLRGMARLGENARLLGLSLTCPSCGERNPTDGRWKCRSCSAVYQGAVFHCSFCGSGASFFSCRRCGISIALRRPA